MNTIREKENFIGGMKMGIKNFPDIQLLENGAKIWQHSFDRFKVKVYIPQADPLSDIVNFGFNAPYLLVLEEKELSPHQAAAFAEEKGFAKIARDCACSVVFIHPTDERGWEGADEHLFIDLVAESKIGPHYQDGVFKSRLRFSKEWGEHFIRGAIFRTFLFGYGQSADYIARHLLKTIQGEYLWGPGEITLTAAVLKGLSVVPVPERRDIPVVSIGNGDAINDALAAACDHFMIRDEGNAKEIYDSFLRPMKRWCGMLQMQEDMAEIGMAEEAAYAMVPTSPDNQGDDMGTKTHPIGYIAYYKKGLFNGGKVPLVLAFHGGGDSALHMAHVSGWYRVAQRNDFLLVCVENHLNSTATEVMHLLSHLKEKYPIDEKRIYASGFSMGGIKSWDLYQEYPQVFAALAPMSATFDVGLNVYGQPAPVEINRDMPVPLFYAGGEISPLPELPCQGQKCADRLAYVLQVNGVEKECKLDWEKRNAWEHPVFGIPGDRTEEIYDSSRDSHLIIHYYQSADGVERTAFSYITGQGHECREHTCEHAWQFMKKFRR